jgi:hypothetical protein
MSHLNFNIQGKTAVLVQFAWFQHVISHAIIAVQGFVDQF